MGSTVSKVSTVREVGLSYVSTNCILIHGCVRDATKVSELMHNAFTS